MQLSLFKAEVLNWNSAKWAIQMTEFSRVNQLLTTCLMSSFLVCAAPHMGLAETTTPDPQVSGEVADGADRAAQELFAKMRSILDRAASARAQEGETDGSIVETFRERLGLDAASRADRLLGEAFGVISEAPVNEMRDNIARHRDNIAELQDERMRLAEREIIEGGTARGADIRAEMAQVEEQIARQEQAISGIREDFQASMAETGVELSDSEAEVLLDSVTGNDLVAFAAAHDAARKLSEQLRRLVDDSGENLNAARRYYAMHTALIAALVDAYDGFIASVDGNYLPKLEGLMQELVETREETRALLRKNPSDAQRRILEGNLEAQDTALEAASAYQDHLERQRATIAKARSQARGDLEVADNTLRTVEASYQLKILIDSTSLDFDALNSIDPSILNRIFENEELRREFQAITDRLGPGS